MTSLSSTLKVRYDIWASVNSMPLRSKILSCARRSLSFFRSVTSTLAVTRSIIFTREPGPLIVRVSGLTSSFPTSYPFAGLVVPTVAAITNSLLTISSNSILMFLGDDVTLAAETPGMLILVGTMTGSVSKLMICVRSAVAVMDVGESRSTVDLLALTVTSTVS